MEKHEIRTLVSNRELRASPDGSLITGYAARFGAIADLGDFTEDIDVHAFDQTLADNDDVICCQNHNVDFLLGRRSSNTLSLKADSDGLQFACQVSRTSPIAQSVVESIRRGDIQGCSFAFLARQDRWEKSRRTLLNVRLFDVSVAAEPAYSGTSCTARSLRAIRYDAKSYGVYKLVAPAPPSEEEAEAMRIRVGLAKLLLR